MKLNKSCFTIFPFFFLILFQFQVSAQTTEDITSQIDALFAPYDSPDSPGASVAVLQKGKIVFKKGYGSANLEYDIPNTPSTIFHVASVSKQFTAFSILLLAEQGKLSLDDDIRKHIPEVPDFGKTITLRHLASHTSGMRDQWNLLSMAGWRMDDVITLEHVLKLVQKQKDLNFEPGSEYNYCNTGFTLLAEVVARVSGKSFTEFTQARIFEPLKMTNTLFYDDHEKIVKNRAYSYNNNNGVIKKSVLSFANVGATSLFTTAEDLCLWAMNFKELKVGSKDIIETMNTEHVLNNGETFSGALGQFVNRHNGLSQIQHGGSDAGYRSYIGRFPEQDFAVAVVSNYGRFNASGMALQVADLYLKDFYEAAEQVELEYKAHIQLSNKQMKKFCATYWNAANSYSRKIYLKNDTLRYFRGPGSESPLAPIGENEFQMMGVDVNLVVQFENRDAKKIMNVIINGGAPIMSEEFEPSNYSKKELAEFEGTYYSEELATSYTFEIQKEGLLVTHNRLSDFSLNPLKADVFLGNRWYFQNVIFVRDEEGKIKGIKVSSGRIRDLWMEKQ